MTAGIAENDSMILSSEPKEWRIRALQAANVALAAAMVMLCDALEEVI